MKQLPGNKVRLLPFLLAPLLAIPFVYAAPPTTATVPYTFSLVYTSSQAADGNTILTGTGTSIFSGDAVGTFTWSATFVTHADGTGVVWANGTFTGTVFDSAPGTMAASFVCQISGLLADCHNVAMVQGTDGLAGYELRGATLGTFTSTTAGYGTLTFLVVSPPA